jgi:hypothetical protein
MGEMRAGDLALVYVTKKQSSGSSTIRAFRALFKLTGSVFESQTQLWPGGRVFPIRVPVRLVTALDVPIDSVRPRVSFLGSLENYGMVLYNTPVRIPMEDVRLILSVAKESQ